jgi:hypothetical protein
MSLCLAVTGSLLLHLVEIIMMEMISFMYDQRLFWSCSIAL